MIMDGDLAPSLGFDYWAGTCPGFLPKPTPMATTTTAATNFRGPNFRTTFFRKRFPF